MLKFLQLAFIRFRFSRYKLTKISLKNHTNTRLAKKSGFLTRTTSSFYVPFYKIQQKNTHRQNAAISAVKFCCMSRHIHKN